MRVAILSDIHANLVALDAVLAAAGPVDAVWHLGDVVGYGPDPNGVVRRLEEIGAIGVRGNHDAAAVGGSEIEWFNPDARRAMEWTREVLAPDARAWLEALPERRTEAGVELVHGSLRQPIWEYVTSTSTAGASLDLMAGALALHGHTHVPVAWLDVEGEVELLRRRDGDVLELGARRALVNPGSVGQPRDGTPTASSLLLDPEAGRMEWRRAAYDIGAVQQAMRDARLPTFLVERLVSGT
ncbi:MAG TPA: metallophosphoesterase family protein [Candidatus Limnocylindrales bacterium]|nr:metallophosphoesterase family protein [Candidatus Limnocylindrales bacterium]